MITVLTFSVDRPAELARCIDSVLTQKHVPKLRHLIFSENADDLSRHPLLRKYLGIVEWTSLSGPPHRGHASPRMAKLRQEALNQIDDGMVCFLDDDNWYLDDHLASLFAILSSRKLPAVYSWRTMVYPDGKPFDGRSFPWHPDTGVASELYDWCLANDVLEVGSPLVKDGPRQSQDWRNVATVDMNEWLFDASAIRSLGFETRFSEGELANQIGEDDKLLRRIQLAGWQIACSQRATVVYQLGGVSNPAAVVRG